MAGADGRWFGPQRCELVRVLEEGEQAAAQQRCGGFVAADQEGHAGGEQFALGEALGVDEAADEIVARFVAALCGDVQQVGAHGPEAALGVLGDLEGEPVAGRESGDSVGPGLELMAVFRGHADQDSGDHGGQGESEVADEVKAAGGLDGVEEFVDRGFDLRAHGLDDPRCEGFVDEAPESGMVGRVGVEQADRVVVLDELETGSFGLGQGIEGGAKAAGGRKPSTVLTEAFKNIGIARDDPAAPGCTPVDRVCGAELVVDRVGVGEKFG